MSIEGIDYLEDLKFCFACYGRQAILFGVRAGDGRMAGFASLSYSDGNGFLADFAVAPEDRRLGIGKALIDERLATADRLRLNIVHIAPLMPSNTLHSYYLARGFEDVGGGHLMWVVS